MGCGGSKQEVAQPEQNKEKPLEKTLVPEPVVAAPEEKPGPVSVYGVPPSMNCVGAIMLAQASGCGKMQQCMPFKDTITEDFRKINPFHAVPALTDGDFSLAESSAVLRYVGETYAKDAYPTDPKLRGFIDWAMDRFGSSYASDAVATIYPLLGFADFPADQDAAGKKCSDNLKEFADVFLKGKFIGGEKLSIADYKVAPFFFSYGHAAVKEKSKVDCPIRIKQFNKDFAAACGDAAGMLSSAGGFSLKEMLDAKLEQTPAEAEEPPAFTPETSGDAAKETKGECVIYGVPPSMNCLGAIMMVTANKCGRMEMCMPGKDTVTEDFLKINPFHAVPALKDGDYCLAESGAILRYASSYVPDAYPEDPKVRGFINWAMDRFNSEMTKDAVATIYPLLGFAETPADQAAAGKKCTDNLTQFADVFLTKGKFIGGEKLSIADYRVAPFFFSYEHAALKEISLVDCPDRIKEFNKDFAAACGDAAGILSSANGFALKEKLDAALAEAAAAAEAETQPAPAELATDGEKAVDATEEAEEKKPPSGCFCCA